MSAKVAHYSHSSKSFTQKYTFSQSFLTRYHAGSLG